MAVSAFELQRMLWRALETGSGSELAPYVRSDATPGEIVVEAEARIEHYAKMVFARFVAALREDYPAVAAELGENGFTALVRLHLQTRPPQSSSLRHLGANLATTLEEHLYPRPLCDLARLEWARVDVFDAIDCATATRDDLQLLFDAATAICLPPAACVLPLSRAALARWDRWVGQEGSATETVEDINVATLVFRRNEAVFHRELSAEEAPLLRMLPASFAQLCGAVAEQCESAELAAQRVAEMILRWVDDCHLVIAAR